MDAASPKSHTKIWDIWIRLFHWLLAASVGFMLFSGETGFLFFEWHRKVGEFVLLLLLFRFLWGVVGSSNARLASLFVSPISAVRHLLHLAQGKVHQERGHNAAGGWAVLIMLLLISFQAISGSFIADEEEFIEGAFYGTLSSDLSDTLWYLHYVNAQILMVVLGIHVIMVFMYLLRAGQNLIKPMITGQMKWVDNITLPQVKFAKAWLGLLLLIVSVGLVGFSFEWFN